MIKRCAIYTRKSTEEGLDQTFNSLDAQREACENYIASQKHEGWRLVKTRFDDGGLSGGTMDRPALQALLAEIDAGRVDIVVVYKVDRLTRSLADFAKLVERFDAKDLSFVSVTQAFNTSNSMGRLTLNVLLSFAQFEREVTAERIRDKIAASRRKGLWTGGNPPLGYDNVDKKLVVNEAEAGIVRKIYALYLGTGCVRTIIRTGKQNGWTTKPRANGKGGKPLSRGPLYHILGNPIYAGLIRGGKDTYPGEHQAIVDRALWDAVQEKRRSRTQWTGPVKSRTSPLAGVLTWKGERLTPDHASKAGRRYRYYVTAKKEHDAAKRIRLKAEDVEGAVAQSFRAWLTAPEAAANDVLKPGAPAAAGARVRQALVALNAGDALAHSHHAVETWRPSIKAVAFDGENLSLALNINNLFKDADADRSLKQEFTIREPIRLENRRQETRLILGTCEITKTPDPSVVALLARAHRWKTHWFENPDHELQSIVEAAGGDATTAHRTLRLAFLAPDIVEALLQGCAPDITAEALKRVPSLPANWGEQRAILKFTAD
ncbi:MAG: recombinase family protein [Amphiplicatus sp.]